MTVVVKSVKDSSYTLKKLECIVNHYDPLSRVSHSYEELQITCRNPVFSQLLYEALLCVYPKDSVAIKESKNYVNIRERPSQQLKKYLEQLLRSENAFSDPEQNILVHLSTLFDCDGFQLNSSKISQNRSAYFNQKCYLPQYHPPFRDVYPQCVDELPISEFARIGDLVTLEEIFQSETFLLNDQDPPLIWKDQLNQQDVFFRSALHEASQNGHSAIVKLLLEQGIDPNLSDYRNQSALHYAAQRGYFDIVAMILQTQTPSSWGLCDNAGNSALHLSLYGNHLSISALLILLGVDIYHENNLGHSPIDIARQMDTFDLFQILFSPQERSPSLQVTQMFELLSYPRFRQMFVHLNVQSTLQYDIALCSCEDSLIQTLLTQNETGLSFMSLALVQGKEESLLQFLSVLPVSSVNLEKVLLVKDKLTRRNLVHIAGIHGRSKFINYLKSYHRKLLADLCRELDYYHNSCILLAGQYGHWTVVQLLLDFTPTETCDQCNTAGEYLLRLAIHNNKLVDELCARKVNIYGGTQTTKTLGCFKRSSQPQKCHMIGSGLTCAIYARNLSLVEWFLSIYEADQDWKTLNLPEGDFYSSKHRNGLSLAYDLHFWEALPVLLRSPHWDLTSQDNHDRTFLHRCFAEAPNTLLPGLTISWKEFIGSFVIPLKTFGEALKVQDRNSQYAFENCLKHNPFLYPDVVEPFTAQITLINHHAEILSRSNKSSVLLKHLLEGDLETVFKMSIEENNLFLAKEILQQEHLKEELKSFVLPSEMWYSTDKPIMSIWVNLTSRLVYFCLLKNFETMAQLLVESGFPVDVLCLVLAAKIDCSSHIFSLILERVGITQEHISWLSTKDILLQPLHYAIKQCKPAVVEKLSELYGKLNLQWHKNKKFSTLAWKLAVKADRVCGGLCGYWLWRNDINDEPTPNFDPSDRFYWNLLHRHRMHLWGVYSRDVRRWCKKYPFEVLQALAQHSRYTSTGFSLVEHAIETNNSILVQMLLDRKPLKLEKLHSLVRFCISRGHSHMISLIFCHCKVSDEPSKRIWDIYDVVQEAAHKTDILAMNLILQHQELLKIDLKHQNANNSENNHDPMPGVFYWCLQYPPRNSRASFDKMLEDMLRFLLDNELPLFPYDFANVCQRQQWAIARELLLRRAQDVNLIEEDSFNSCLSSTYCARYGQVGILCTILKSYAQRFSADDWENGHLYQEVCLCVAESMAYGQKECLVCVLLLCPYIKKQHVQSRYERGRFHKPEYLSMEEEFEKHLHQEPFLETTYQLWKWLPKKQNSLHFIQALCAHPQGKSILEFVFRFSPFVSKADICKYDLVRYALAYKQYATAQWLLTLVSHYSETSEIDILPATFYAAESEKALELLPRLIELNASMDSYIISPFGRPRSILPYCVHNPLKAYHTLESGKCATLKPVDTITRLVVGHMQKSLSSEIVSQMVSQSYVLEALLENAPVVDSMIVEGDISDESASLAKQYQDAALYLLRTFGREIVEPKYNLLCALGKHYMAIVVELLDLQFDKLTEFTSSDLDRIFSVVIAQQNITSNETIFQKLLHHLPVSRVNFSNYLLGKIIQSKHLARVYMTYVECPLSILLSPAIGYVTPPVLRNILMKFYPHGPTWRTADDTGNTITHYISAFGSLQLLQELLERMMPQALALEALSGTNLALQTPMHMACAFNNTSNALFLAELMPNNLLHQADSQGNTPFHYACLHGNNKLVKKLFSSEGLVLRNVHGSNSLGLAWANGHSKVLGQVLHQYPDLEVVCSNQLVDFKNSQQYLGWFRRLMHINQHRPDLCLVEFPHEVEGKYWEPTRWWEVETAVRYGKLSMVCAFVQAGAVVHLQTILLLCAKYGKLELFDKLLSDSQQSLFLDSFREQVLVEVFSRGYPRFCSRILSWIETNHLTHTVSNLVDAQGNGLLHWAARHRWLKLFTTLEERFHCSLHSPNNHGETPLQIAWLVGGRKFHCLTFASANLSELIQECVKHGARHWAVKYIHSLGIANIEPSILSSLGFLCCQSGLSSLVKELISYQPELLYFKDHKLRNCAHVAAQGNHLSVLKLLSQHVHELFTQQDQKGRTPLMHAAKLGLFQVLQFFHSTCKKAFGIRDYQGESLMYYCGFDFESVRFLQQISDDLASKALTDEERAIFEVLQADREYLNQFQLKQPQQVIVSENNTLRIILLGPIEQRVLLEHLELITIGTVQHFSAKNVILSRHSGKLSKLGNSWGSCQLYQFELTLQLNNSYHASKAELRVCEFSVCPQFKIKHTKSFLRKVEELFPRLRKNYFTRLIIREDYILEDSLVNTKSWSLKNWTGNIRIRFLGKSQAALDAGGLVQEWFYQVSLAITNPLLGIFSCDPESKHVFLNPNLHSIQERSEQVLRFLGFLIGSAILQRKILHCNFSHVLIKQLLQKPLTLEDLQSVDETLYQSLKWVLSTSEDVSSLGLNFVCELDSLDERHQVELLPGGASMEVCGANKELYVRLMLEYFLLKGTQPWISVLGQALYQIIPLTTLKRFTPEEFYLLINGIPNLDLAEMRRFTTIHNHSNNSLMAEWFWQSISQMSSEQRSRFLQYVTNAACLPPGGFANLEPPLQVVLTTGEGQPQVHTCFHSLVIPVSGYSSHEQFHSCLLQAMEYDACGYGFV